MLDHRYREAVFDPQWYTKRLNGKRCGAEADMPNKEWPSPSCLLGGELRQL